MSSKGVRWQKDLAERRYFLCGNVLMSPAQQPHLVDSRE